MDTKLMSETAKAMVAKGKGLLAADESAGTCKKRFDSVKVECNEENRRAYRELLFTTPKIADYVSGVIDWGSWRFQRHMVGNFGIVDETEETHAPEASVRGICLAPSVETLEWLLKRVGFARVERLLPPPDGHEQLVAHKRAMFAAFV